MWDNLSSIIRFAFSALLATQVVPSQALLPPFYATQIWSSIVTQAKRVGSPLPLLDQLELQSSVRAKPLLQKASTATKTDEARVEGSVPFVIQRVEKSREKEFREIADMCIDVFFKDGGTVNGSSLGANSALLKSMNLGYLRSLSYSDLRARKFMMPGRNVQLVARRVIPSSPSSSSVAVDPREVFNAKQLGNVNDKVANGDMCYVLGDVLGFVEVTVREFGLGRGDDLTETGRAKLRPVLANLAVKKEVRRSGVGSKLMEACEDAVLAMDARHEEIILQVEEDNPQAMKFYEKRGYRTVFADPTCRRYDLNNLFLKQVRATKYCMRKDLGMKRLLRKRNKDASNVIFGSKLLDAFRDAVVSVKV